MRILWVCNIMLPAIAKHLNMDYSVREGWLTGTLSRMIEESKTKTPEMKLGICFPAGEEMRNWQEEIVFEQFPVSCYGFFENLNTPEIYDEGLEVRFREIMDDFKPDMIHIFGTEFPHALAAAKVFGKKERTLIGIQGVISRCAEEYFADLPEYVVKRATFRDRLKKDSVINQQEKFRLRGINENKALKLAGHITGRTDFDRTYSGTVCEGAVYHSMNETLRPQFYEGDWDEKTCCRHRIFFSQADYPLKGFHFMLEALPAIMEAFPDTEVVVAGNSLVSKKTYVDRIKRSSYGKYLLELIEKNKLQGKIRFTGSLSADQMKEQYLNCHTFVCASVLENSPNSLGEAMLLGVPVVASRVGGIPSMVEHGKDGLLFERGNSKELAEHVISLWKDEDFCATIGKNGQKRARVTHDAKKNYERLIEIYHAIMR